jgi:hypothetical protein
VDLLLFFNNFYKVILARFFCLFVLIVSRESEGLETPSLPLCCHHSFNLGLMIWGENRFGMLMEIEFFEHPLY